MGRFTQGGYKIGSQSISHTHSIIRYTESFDNQRFLQVIEHEKTRPILCIPTLKAGDDEWNFYYPNGYNYLLDI